MNHIGRQRLRIAARNEGKIKSYESCTDVRAWSHDMRTRNRYLRDWIKCDMPICVVPVCTLSSILSIMTRSSGRVSPRCHSRCQSKVLLDGLCSSCTVLKDCLSNNREFEKYFREEEDETINWPCDKCLEILKSIKMFWKIVVEKVLKVNLLRPNDFKSAHICSIQNIAKEWQKEMVEEALFVRSNTLIINQNSNIKKVFDSINELKIDKEDKYLNRNFRNKITETDCAFRSIAIQTDGIYIRQKISKCTCASIKMANLECKSHSNKDNEVIMIYKNNIRNLQQQYNVQKHEMDRLRKENVALTVELQRCRQNHPKNIHNCDQPLKAVDNTIALISSPFDSNENFDFNTPKAIDSEMIITLKNCRNENFRHVSVIQVLHKSNELNLSEINRSYFKKEDPIHILNKVHDTFEAIVNREISIASKRDKSFSSKNVIIKSLFRNVSESKSAPSSSTSSYSLSSESNFASANETITIRSEK